MQASNFLTFNRTLRAAARRIGYGLLALGLVVPTQAYPLSLQRLLELPLETLLQLDITVRAPAARKGGKLSAIALALPLPLLMRIPNAAAGELRHVR